MQTTEKKQESHRLIERKEDSSRKMSKNDLAHKLDAMHERDNELVTGVFRYIEYPGGTLRFVFQQYAQDGLVKYELCDGERYKLPRMVARHLNKNVHYLEYKRLDKNILGDQVQMGVVDPVMSSSKGMFAVSKRPRCEFRSLEFMDDDLELQPSKIIEVVKKA